MTRRLSSLLIALVMVLSVTACGGGTVSTSGGSESTPSGEISSQSGGGASSSLSDASGSGSDADSSGESGGADPESGSGSQAQTPEGSADTSIQEPDLPVEGEYYYDLENVVLYLETYGELPENYITKNEARDLGWSGGPVDKYLEGAAIGGDHFGNREGLLPDGNYTECDLNTLGANGRGAERLVFSDNWEYYYTGDHYESFSQVWVDNGEVVWEAP